MTGVVNTTFDDKVQRSAITESQVTSKEVRKEMDALRTELDALSRDRKGDQQRINSLEENNRLLQTQLEAAGNAPSGEPMPSMTQPLSGAVPPPTQFYPGASVSQAGETTFAPIPRKPVALRIRHSAMRASLLNQRCPTSRPAASPRRWSSKALTPTPP